MTVDLDSINQLLSVLELQWKVESFQSMPGGMSASMTLVSFITPTGNHIQWVVRQLSSETLALRPHAVKMEFDLLKDLNSRGLPVAKPVFLDDAGRIFGSPSLVMEYVPGDVNFSAHADFNRPEKLADFLAQLHKIDVADIKDVAVPDLSLDFKELCGDMPEKPNEDLHESLIRNELKKHWPPSFSNPPVLLHGDYWNGNILWNCGEISGIIDWEDAWIGEPLSDLAGTRVDLAYTYGKEQADLFTEAYLEHNKIDVHCLPLWDLVAALWLIRFINNDLASWASFYHTYGRTDITSGLLKARINEFSEAALNRLGKQ